MSARICLSLMLAAFVLVILGNVPGLDRILDPARPVEDQRDSLAEALFYAVSLLATSDDAAAVTDCFEVTR